jgi:hypothetical protein
MVVPIRIEMDVQATRILDFCTQAAPGCIVHVMPLGPDNFKVKVKDEGNTLVDTEQTLYTREPAAKSDEELWKLLETVSNQRIKRTRLGDDEANESQQIGDGN